MKALPALALAGMAVAAACDDTPVLPDTELLVVRAYLFAGQAVEDVQLTLAVPLSAEDQTIPPVTDAVVTLRRDGTAYALVPNPGLAGFYQYLGDDLTVEPGDVFDLEISFQGGSVTATTTVPSPPAGVALSSDVLEVQQGGFGGGGRGGGGGGFQPGALTVRWDNPGGGLFYAAVDNIEESPVAFGQGPGNFPGRPTRFTSAPTAADSLPILQFSLTHFGMHRVLLFQVNQEYADLFLGRIQDTRDLNEPPSNITGGLGVFSAFAADSAFFRAEAG